MNRQKMAGSILLAVLIGTIHTYLIVWVWTYIALITPLPRWLISQGITGASLRAAILPADLLTNMVLCVPAAYLLCKLRPQRLWLYLALAVVPGFLWQYRLFLGDISLFQGWLRYLPGVLMAALPLPLTALLIRHVTRWGAPNNHCTRRAKTRTRDGWRHAA